MHLPEQYTDMHSGEATEAGELAAEQWSNLISGTNELGRVMLEEYGIELVFHPHVDTHVDTQERIEQFLQDTDPRYVNLCLDTGHIAYRAATTSQIVKGLPSGSATCTSSRSTRRSASGCAGRSCPCPKP